MKASELIYRLAKGIEAHGDQETKLTLDDGKGNLYEFVDIKCLDLHKDKFEIYGEEQ